MAALQGGGFVVVWTSFGEDTWGDGVYGQRYDAAGNAVGAEFRVNYNTVNYQHRPTVTGLVNGGFVVAWDDDSNVWLQQYDAGGHAIDSQVVVNDISTETAPDIVATADGGFLVAYQGWRDTAHGGNNTYEALVQRYSNTAPSVSDVAVGGVHHVVPTLKLVIPLQPQLYVRYAGDFHEHVHERLLNCWPMVIRVFGDI